MSKDWQVESIGKLFTIRPPKKEALDVLNKNELVSFVPMANLNEQTKELTLNLSRQLSDVYSGYTFFAENDVLLAKITPCFENGKLGIARGLVNGIGFGSSEFFVLRTKGRIIPEYLFYFLSNEQFRTNGKKQMNGAVGHKRVPKDFIENYKLSFPASLDEQKRIVKIFDEAFAAIEKAKANAEKNLQNAKELFQSQLNQIFSQKGEDWAKLSDLATDITDGDHAPPPKSQSGIPFITISNINKRTYEIDFSDTFKVSETYFQNLKDKRKPKKGDVLYTVTGSFGIPIIVSDNLDFCFQRHIGLIRPKAEINSKWLYYLLQSSMVYNQACNGATGTAQKTVSLKILRSFSIPKMSVGEQKRIVTELEALSEQTKRLEAIYQQKLDDIEELKKSILQKAFDGQL